MGVSGWSMSKANRVAVARGLPLILLSLPLLALATAQEGDILIMKGKKYSIQSEPLRAYIRENPNKLPESEVVSTSNWRGYLATWEVKDEQLFLVDVTILRPVKSQDGGFSTEPRSVMASLFPDQKEVPAVWFTGHVIAIDGELVHYVHMGYASMYAKYIILRVEEGRVTRTWNANTAAFAIFRNSQFNAFKKTDEFRDGLARCMKEGGRSEKECEESLRQFSSEWYLSMIFDKPR